RAVERPERRLERAAAGEGNGILLLFAVAADAAAGLGEIFAPFRIALGRRAAEDGAEHKTDKQAIRALSEPDHAVKHNKRPRKRKPRRGGAFGLQRFLVLLLAEILVAVPATSLADLGDRRLYAGFVTGFRRGHEGADRALELFLRFLELGRFAPDRRQGGGFHVLQVLGAFREAVPGHLAQHLEVARVASDDIAAIRDLPLRHGAHWTIVLPLQGHRRLALLDQYFGLDLRKSGERVSRPERQGESGQQKPLFHSISPQLWG